MEADSTTGQNSGKNYHWVILGVLLGSQVFMSMGAYAWGPLAPFLQDSLNLSLTEIGLITAALYMASVVVSIPAGFTVDRFGSRVNLLICLGVMGVAMMLMGLVNSYALLIAFTAFAGIGYGMINPVAAKGITQWFSTRLRATAMGIRQAGVTIGGAIGGVLLTVLAQAYDWHVAVMVVGAVMLVMVVVSFIFYKESFAKVPAATPTTSNSQSQIPPQQKLGFRSLVTERNLLLIAVIFMLLAMGQSSVGAFLVLYLNNEVVSFPVVLAGTCFTTAMIAGGVGRVGWGVVSDRLLGGKRKEVLLITCVIAICGSVGAAFLTEGVPQWLPFLVAIILGISYLGFQGVGVAFIVEISGPAMAGKATGLVVTVAWIGIVLGAPIFGAIAGNVGYFWGWIMLAATSGIAALLCLFLKEETLIKD